MNVSGTVTRNCIQKQNDNTDLIPCQEHSGPPAALQSQGKDEEECKRQGMGGSVLIDRLGLCEPFFTECVLSHNTSDFNHLYV